MDGYQLGVNITITARWYTKFLRHYFYYARREVKPSQGFGPFGYLGQSSITGKYLSDD